MNTSPHKNIYLGWLFMKVFDCSFKKIIAIILIAISLLLICLVYHHFWINKDNVVMVMGGTLYSQREVNNNNQVYVDERDYEKYFRPSKLPILNNKNTYRDLRYLNEKAADEISLPLNLLQTPEDTIVNYYSILREAANPQKEKWAGCGTIGYATNPYPISYKFLASHYADTLNYKNYVKSFENILHINLIKLKEIAPDKDHPNSTRHFIELETIEGTEKGIGVFTYYFGYLYTEKENRSYKISDIQLYNENYLCAPYHGWEYIAEAAVDIKYGEWCSLLKKRLPTQKEGYIKNIKFRGTNGEDYKIEFVELTNGTDIEIAQYKKDKNGDYVQIFLDPKDCLKKSER